MLMYREVSWWYWAVTAVLLFLGLAGNPEGFWLAIGLSTVHVAHFHAREGDFSAFPVQVRVAYTAMLILFLMPWNRRAPMSAALVSRAFLSRPVKGSVMQGLPALR